MKLNVDLQNILSEKQYKEVLYVARARAEKKNFKVEKIVVNVSVIVNTTKKVYPDTLDWIHDIVRGAYGRPDVNIDIKTRQAEIIKIRQVFQAFAYWYSGYKPALLELWTSFDRCTYYYSKKVVLQRYATEPEYREFIDIVDKDIRAKFVIKKSRIKTEIIV